MPYFEITYTCKRGKTDYTECTGATADNAVEAAVNAVPLDLKVSKLKVELISDADDAIPE